MPGVNVGIASFSRRGDGGERAMRDARRARMDATHAGLLKAAKAIASATREAPGLYRIDPATFLALREAADKSDREMNGGSRCE